MIRRLLFLITLALLTMPLSAQYDILDFRWELTDLAFSYPAAWDEPFAVQRFGIESVLLAESDVRDAERPAEIPYITLELHPITETDPATLLQERLAENSIQPTLTIPTIILDRDGLWAQGSSRDGTLFGMGASVQLGDNLVIIIGRTPIDQSVQFEYSFDLLIRSLSSGQAFGDLVPFGLVWSNTTDDSEGDAAFTNLSAVKLDETTNSLYAVDDFVGLLRFDMLSGRLESIVANSDFDIPTEIAIGTENTIYISDIGCRCIHIYQNEAWQDPLLGFGEDAPFSMTTSEEGTLYATGNNSLDLLIHQYTVNEETSRLEETQLILPVDISNQPILFTDDNQPHLLDVDNNDIYQLDESGFTIINTLAIDTFPLLIEVAPDNTYALMTTSSVDLYDFDGFMIDTLDLTNYSTGTNLISFDVGSDGTVYLAVRDSNFGEVLAVSQRVPEAKFGLQTLAPYRLSGGILNPNSTQDIWLIDGTNNERISLYALGYAQTNEFDYTMTIIEPDGTEIITVSESSDIQLPLARKLENIVFSSDGFYEVRIDHTANQGLYELMLIDDHLITLAPDITTVWGEFTETYSRDTWAFQADGRTTITITVESIDPAQLNVAASLSDPQYRQIAQNNDAESNQLGNSAQIVEFVIPFSGIYYLDVNKVNGVGTYSLTIDIIEPVD